MIICIESHLGDTYLSGKARTKSELKQQLLHTEAIRDVEHDNFLPLLCRLYGWEEIAEDAADYTWDRDTKLLLPVKKTNRRAGSLESRCDCPRQSLDL